MTHSKPLISLSNSCHVLFSYDDTDDTICAADEPLFKSLVVFLTGLIDPSCYFIISLVFPTAHSC